MKIRLLSSAPVSEIFEFVTYINKSDNMTALVESELSKDGYFIITVESF